MVDRQRFDSARVMGSASTGPEFMPAVVLTKCRPSLVPHAVPLAPLLTEREEVRALGAAPQAAYLKRVKAEAAGQPRVLSETVAFDLA